MLRTSNEAYKNRKVWEKIEQFNKKGLHKQVTVRMFLIILGNLEVKFDLLQGICVYDC